jgi:signal transduction histidine kinase
MRVSLSLRATPYLVLLLGLTATGLVTHRFERAATQRNEIRFQNAVAAVQDRLQARLDMYTVVLLGAKGFFAGSESVVRDEFRRYVAELELQRRAPGIQGVGYSLRVAAADRARVEEEMHAAGFPEFRIWPTTPRDEYHTILYLEPFDRRNRAALGFDMYSEPRRRAAMSQARDTGLPAVTEPVTLVQEIDAVKPPGFLIYVPVYRHGAGLDSVASRRENLLGFVYSPFRCGDFLLGIFGSEPSPMISFAVVDRGTHERLMDSSPGALPARYRPRYQTSASLDVAGRTWDVTLASTPAFDALSSGGRTLFLASGGTLLSLLFAVLMGAQAWARSRAEESDRAAQAEREHLHRLFMQAPAPILIQRGREQILEFMNSAAIALVGPRPLGKPVREGFADVDLPQLQFLDRVYETGERFVGLEISIIADWKNDGQRTARFFNIVHEPMRRPNGAVDGIMTFGFDVTEEVLARKKVEALAEDLHRAVRVRDDFLSIAGHELRTPLAALLLQVEGLQRQALRNAFVAHPDVLIDRVGKTRAHAQRLERLVGELLDVGRISAGRLTLELEDVDLGALVGEVAERFADQLARSGCTLTVTAPERVVGRWDRLRLDQVITNLLANAIKYGARQPIDLRVERLAEGARLTVIDRGIGIAPADQGRIFERFERAVSDRHYGGLGLGLWISREIVEALRGSISVESAVGAGSTFVVTLPTS